MYSALLKHTSKGLSLLQVQRCAHHSIATGSGLASKKDDRNIYFMSKVDPKEPVSLAWSLIYFWCLVISYVRHFWIVLEIQQNPHRQSRWDRLPCHQKLQGYGNQVGRRLQRRRLQLGKIWEGLLPPFWSRWSVGHSWFFFCGRIASRQDGRRSRVHWSSPIDQELFEHQRHFECHQANQGWSGIWLCSIIFLQPGHLG